MPGPPRRRGRGHRAELRKRRRDITDSGGEVSVVVSAWKATRYIIEALDSIRNQEPRKGWEYSLRIGVDGCEDTARLLDRAGTPYWWSPVNVGPYVMRNSLIGLQEATAYAIFDADDVMRPTYLLELLEWVGPGGIAGAGRTQIDETGKILRRRTRYKSGVCIISHAAWGRVGGYRPWPMAADYDLIVRAERLQVPVRAVAKALYIRRVHPSSLTQARDTGFKSQQRQDLARRTKSLAKHPHNLRVFPVTTELELRVP